MQDLLVFAVILAALLIGFGAGIAFSRKPRAKRVFDPDAFWPQQHYFKGLTQLLNEEPDAAIDTFISSIDVNSDTLETHLALGSLLRRKGEVERAIRVHQNLLSRSNLTTDQQYTAQMELALDYLRSGLLDRAEMLLKELADAPKISNPMRKRALECLIELYQDMREWLSAIDVADRLTARKFSGPADKWRRQQAHYACEIAQTAITQKDWLTARRWVRTAMRHDKDCARASLLSAQLDIAQKEYAKALISLRQIVQQDERYLSEMLPLAYSCHKKLESMPVFLNELTALYEHKGELLVLRYLAKAVEMCEGGDAVISLLMQELPQYPQMEVAGALLKIVLDERGPASLRNYVQVKGLLKKLTDSKYHYQCTSCGFTGEQLHWLCPSCKSWASQQYTSVPHI
ncbi:lipopolysaccharide assembly protein LapB [Saccharophagus degradans]|uniref:Lipopolysaccharide assembly protein B n=1 Tax=Saccharophagus degradans TaxID=86304 RepID=A0AAW7X359_9GAMM|nr:lipopolysaccharide assembly protein LapB [Saccharophagus degradans]MDO6421051.1 lipopolysaccharide assembly protein LapB [Saccharophagus degradans]MDO6606038.1 lipopolysaccharide assembly protein LapB [Saccharophagus degradans]